MINKYKELSTVVPYSPYLALSPSGEEVEKYIYNTRAPDILMF